MSATSNPAAPTDAPGVAVNAAGVADADASDRPAWDGPWEPVDGDPGPDPLLDQLTARAAGGRTPATDVDLDRIRTAWRVAARAHDGQFRQSGEPYITHPIAVAAGCVDLGLDVDTIVAALLHDTVEDTDVTLDDLVRLFGSEIAHLVDGVTKLDAVDRTAGDRQQLRAATLRKMLVALSDDLRVLLLKLVDRRHNVSTLGGGPAASSSGESSPISAGKRERVARETLEVYVPLAARLGVWQLKSELEDHAFAQLDPDSYAATRRALARRSPAASAEMAQLVSDLEVRLAASGIDAEVTGRTKSAWSTYQKATARNVPVDSLHDLLGVRVVCHQPAECYQALYTIHEAYPPVPATFTDYIATPKFNLYQSLHTTVMSPSGTPVEIQLRTVEMHRRAEHGAAAHHAYKPAGRDEQLAWVSQLTRQADMVADADEFLAAVQADLVRDEVFVFTRDGDLLHLPAGATPLDVAYEIHTEVGDRCVGVRVNGHQAPARTTLHSGDQVEIICGDRPGPSPAWLHHTVTAKAQAAILRTLARQARANERDAGLRELKLTAAEHGLDDRDGSIDDPAALHRISVALGRGDQDGLLRAVGAGDIAAAQVVAHLVDDPAGPSRRAALTISATDRLGLLADLAAALTAAGVPILTSASTSHLNGTAALTVTVVDQAGLADARRRLQQVPGVYAVDLD